MAENNNNITEGITDLESMKQMWNEVNGRLTRLEEQLNTEGRRVFNEKITSAQSNLARRYKRFVILASIMAFIVPLTFVSLPEDYGDTPLKWVIMVSYMLFFILVAIMDCNLYSGVNSIDPALMPVTEVVERVKKLRRRHHIFQLCLLPMALALIIMLGILYKGEKEILIAMGIGAAAGVAIGLPQYFRFMSAYRQMQNYYE